MREISDVLLLKRNYFFGLHLVVSRTAQNRVARVKVNDASP